MSGPEYLIFQGINTLKTLQRLAARTQPKGFFWEINFLKTSRNFEITTNLSENLEKYLLKNTFLVKLLTPSLQFCQKKEPHYWYIPSNLSASKESLLQIRPQRKKSQFWNWMDIMLLKVSCSLFSAVRSLHVEVMDGQSFTKQRWIVWLTPFAFECKW